MLKEIVRHSDISALWPRPSYHDRSGVWGYHFYTSSQLWAVLSVSPLFRTLHSSPLQCSVVRETRRYQHRTVRSARSLVSWSDRRLRLVLHFPATTVRPLYILSYPAICLYGLLSLIQTSFLRHCHYFAWFVVPDFGLESKWNRQAYCKGFVVYNVRKRPFRTYAGYCILHGTLR